MRAFIIGLFIILVSGVHAQVDAQPLGLIVFSRFDGIDHELYTMRADGTDERQLTDNDVDDLVPSWSPDGEQVVFSRFVDGDFELFIRSS